MYNYFFVNLYKSKINHMEIKIYTLHSTRNLQEIRYVGKTKQTLKRRLAGHLSAAKKKFNRWLYS